MIAHLATSLLPGETAKRSAELVGEYFLFTLAVLLTTVPIMVYHFGRYPLLTPLSNLMVLPVQPAVMILGGISLLVGMVSLPLGQVVSYLAWPFLAYTVHLAEFWAQFQTTILDLGKTSLGLVIAFYGFLFALTLGHTRLLTFWRNRSAILQPSTSRGAGIKAWLGGNAKIIHSGLLLLMGVLTFLV